MLVEIFEGIGLVIFGLFILFVFRVLFCCWVSPFLVHKKLKRNGFRGPTPCFPLGNISEMKRMNANNPNSTVEDSSSHHQLTHDIHSTVFPYFARWQTTYGKHSYI